MCFCKALGWDTAKYLNDAKSLMGHVDGKGVDPSGLVKAFRKQGYKATWHEHATLEECIDFLHGQKNAIVVLDYWDDNFGSCDGHYVLFRGLTQHGNLRIWNPDAPTIEEFVLYRSKFLNSWYDYTIDTFRLLQRVAVFAHQ